MNDVPAAEDLPPLPDGGLAAAMPAWLQQAPSRPAQSRAPETIDLSSLTAGIEVPEWLHDLSRRVDAGSAPAHSPEERPLAEAVVEHAPEVGEPELALIEPDLEAVADADAASDEAPALVTPVDPDDGGAESQPAPVLRFQVRSGTATMSELGSGESDASSRPVPTTSVQRMQSAAESPRSVGATVLLVLLLVGLAAIGVWYYWM